MKPKHLHSRSILLAALIVCAHAAPMAQEKASSPFFQEMQSIHKTLGRGCSNWREWKDEGTSCQKWIDAIDRAESGPQTSAREKHDAIAIRVHARRLYGDGLSNRQKAERALEEYDKALAEMKAHAETGHQHVWLDGYEVLTGLARSLQEAGNSEDSDLMYGQVRGLTQNVAGSLETRADQLPQHLKARFIEILLVGERAEERWAQQLSERAARRAIAGDMKQAGALWVQAGQAFEHAASHAASADKAGASRTDMAALIPASVRIGGYHRHAADQWLLVNASGPERESLGIARERYQQSQAQLRKAEEELMGTGKASMLGIGQPSLGITGKHMQASRIGLGEVLAREGKLKEAASVFLSAQKELSPISRREMSLRAEQGKADKRWLSDAVADTSECEAEFRQEIVLSARTSARVSDPKSFCRDIALGAQSSTDEELLPRYDEKDIDGLRLQARLSTAKARWQGGSWQEAKAAWEQVRAAADADQGERKDKMGAADEFALRQVQQWAARHAASRR